ncbi:uncharacterized protein LOC131677956 isoform X2 [Topomyia yanbarensis]|uniref:uncharacterized protein LOC131677956 isoform X2 n=1 Tax=Topomyia yanbarensis TaxID=2498891 RepID=UPI00273BEA58|nr:uncharacterized protein LOC131677956 isoform X2 [Topomyia yanbarensis]
MAVLLSFHQLIEKDSRRVNYCWKTSILVVLFMAISSSLVITFSMQSLEKSFHQNCFMGASLNFITVQSSSLLEFLQKTHSSRERQMLYNLIRAAPEGEKYIINEFNSTWSNQDFCEYLKFTPLFHAMVSVIWLALFIMHGPGGEGIGSIITKPWRIVFPSLIFFTICGISAFVCATLSSDALAEFCEEFSKIDNEREVSCARMITYFSLRQHNDLILPDKNYYLIASFPWIWVGSYICGVLIMLLRIMLVVDFQLIRIVVSIVETGTETESEEHVVEILDESDKDSQTIITEKNRYRQTEF